MACREGHGFHVIAPGGGGRVTGHELRACVWLFAHAHHHHLALLKLPPHGGKGGHHGIQPGAWGRTNIEARGHERQDELQRANAELGEMMPYTQQGVLVRALGVRDLEALRKQGHQVHAMLVELLESALTLLGAGGRLDVKR